MKSVARYGITCSFLSLLTTKEHPSEKMEYHYGDGFFNYNDLAVKSAESITEIVQNEFKLKSVLDIGCARGVWLNNWKRVGVNTIHGVDGEYLNKHQIKLNNKEFSCKDVSKPFDLGKQFDLVQCLEVAEHVDKKYAGNLVENIVRHGNLVLFSAATPGQGGEHHVNEQWYSYWYELFKIHGYGAFDWIRPQLVNLSHIARWYKYNIFLFAKKEKEAVLSDVIRDTKCVNGHLRDIAPILYRIRRYLVRCIPYKVQNRIAGFNYFNK